MRANRWHRRFPFAQLGHHEIDDTTPVLKTIRALTPSIVTKRLDGPKRCI
jgi:hypothetical protein